MSPHCNETQHPRREPLFFRVPINLNTVRLNRLWLHDRKVNWWDPTKRRGAASRVVPKKSSGSCMSLQNQHDADDDLRACSHLRCITCKIYDRLVVCGR